MTREYYNRNKERISKKNKERYRTHGRTFSGVVEQIYKSMRDSSRKRKMTPPDFSLEELFIWFLEQKNANFIFLNWRISCYSKWMKPSCDRIDDYKSYSLDNLKLGTWLDNSKNGNNARKNGLNNKDSKAVTGINTKTGEIVKFHSGIEASRRLNIKQASISKVCLNKPHCKSAGGYKWSYDE